MFHLLCIVSPLCPSKENVTKFGSFVKNLCIPPPCFVCWVSGQCWSCQRHFAKFSQCLEKSPFYFNNGSGTSHKQENCNLLRSFVDSCSGQPPYSSQCPPVSGNLEDLSISNLWLAACSWGFYVQLFFSPQTNSVKTERYSVSLVNHLHIVVSPNIPLHFLEKKRESCMLMI